MVNLDLTAIQFPLTIQHCKSHSILWIFFPYNVSVHVKEQLHEAEIGTLSMAVLQLEQWCNGVPSPIEGLSDSVHYPHYFLLSEL